tara:strand:- start:6329 stop:7066 length:738 start_codon:yes stop_codon:yes gene_type:complete
MVPSWTETLISVGLNVVGRTRFCVHPRETVKDIPAVGGTKNWDWQKVQAIRPDLILLDKEENPKFISEQSDFAWHASHIQSIHDMPLELKKLSSRFNNKELDDLAQRWQNVVNMPSAKTNAHNIPGLIRWGKTPDYPIDSILYMIWRKPWMTVSQKTFIGSMLARVGISIENFETKYPEIDLENYEEARTLLLLSSEPYPFLNKEKELSNLKFPHAFVDGEAFSWFGVRSLMFLEKHLHQKTGSS